MRKLTCILILLATLSLHGQETGDGEALLNYMKRAMRFGMFYPQEKVYLHLDNTGYFTGETIWFKAYVTRADTERATDLSKILYVELLNPSGDVVERRKLQIDHGQAYGDIKIENIMVTGFYEIRAFTRYMTNWGTYACFSRVIPIFKAPVREGDYSNPQIDQISYRHRLNNERIDAADEGDGNLLNLSDSEGKAKAVKEKDDAVKMRFYPEGGNMVKGLPSKVAFLLTDEEGRPLRTKVSVTDGSGQEVVATTSDADGRGCFLLPQGEAGRKVVVQKPQGGTKTFSLPDVQDEGCTVQVDVMNDSSLVAELYASEGVLGKKIGYVMMNNGKVVRCDTLTVQPQQTISFVRSKLPEGVNQLTFFGSDGRIMAERRFFIFPKSHKEAHLQVSSGGTSIKPCGKVTIQLQTDPLTSMSFSAVDGNGMVNGREGNIRTWMLLGSDLRGYIAHPEYYLESDDEVHRRATDLLMLVQGWRRYDWRLMTGQSMFEKYQTIETQLNLFGKLKSKGLTKKAVENVWLDAKMYNMSGQVVEGTTKTDSLGNYVFSLPDVTGEWNLSLNTGVADKKGNWKDVEYYIGIDRHFSPAGKYVSAQEAAPVPVDEKKFLRWTMSSEDEEWVSMTNKNHVLKNVTVKAKGRVWDRTGWNDERTARSASNIFYNVDIEADRLADEGKALPSLTEWLESKNEFFRADENPIDTFTKSNLILYHDGPSYKNRPLIWVVDNSFVTITQCPNVSGDLEILYNNNSTMNSVPTDSDGTMLDLFSEQILMDVDWAKSVYISEDLEKAHQYFFSPRVDAMNPVVIYLYTHRQMRRHQKGIRYTHFQGYDEPSVFQMEDYNVIPPMEDYRRTLFWTPVIQADEAGKATVEFFNNSSCHEMQIFCEGMTPAGKFVANE